MQLLTEKIINECTKDKQIIAVLAYGSRARGEKNYRDTDICIVLNKKYTDLEMSKKRVKISSLASEKYDFQVFQQLPLYIRKSILKDAKILLCKNEDKLYEIVFSTIKEFSLYEKLYNMYLAKIKNG